MEPQDEILPSSGQVNEEIESNTLSEPQVGTFYSVYVPQDVRAKDSSICQNIFKDKIEALKLVKKSKKARFKYFEFYHEALKFAISGTLEPSGRQLNGSVKHVTLSPQIANEKLSPFKGPKPQDLVKLRKLIENGDVEGFRQTVWENPRYLVSSGDTPSILQEGFRYNALHVAAKAKNGVIAELILNTISNPSFVKLMYGEDQHETNVESRAEVLLDLYLNTPDKGLNETPLHFAAKFGAVDVVEVLVSFPECDKSLKNKYGQTPDMIICDRVDNKDATVKKKIAMHLENCYYVPVLRAEDNSLTPLIGEPFSPGEAPILNKDPLSPRLEIHAYAGPMNKENADQFRKVWKTPPRTSTPIKRKKTDLDSIVSLRYTDPTKGLERLGQKLANKFDVNWKEYWSFLDCFVDVASEEGLNKVENFLAARIDIVDELHTSSSDSSEDSSCSNRSKSTIADLCLKLQNCNIGDDSNEDSNFNAFLCVEKACNVFANRIAGEFYQSSYFGVSDQFNFLEVHMKQVELLVSSYLDDSRFKKVNFSRLHSRLGLLAARRMCYFVAKHNRTDHIRSLRRLLVACVDCYSSDDEGNPIDNKPTSITKQLICLLQNFLNNFGPETELKRELNDEQSCREAWSKSKECSCVYPLKKTRKSLGLSRNNSKHLSRSALKSSRKALFCKREATIQSPNEEFYTPPTSPTQLTDSDSDDTEYVEPPLLPELFVEGPKPTRSDNALYKAIKYSDSVISPTTYPNIYRWYHNVNLYPEAVRESWSRPKTKLNQTSSFNQVTPPRNSSPKVPSHTPSSSWLRITGANSPRPSLLGKIYL